ncbi:hypothetical protein G6L28_15540 [Agrobacterium larrymoorei]|uniref:DUF3617 domain-containing protein n=1 Tax=Agrobacterium larrymoorei TaxID=160699 RepID=UPI001574D778|nr:hypothetical protein [Agrobacterium larrymoorei]NTJ44014.1 hypothetical protein [Agrobacterium larrymoorei]
MNRFSRLAVAFAISAVQLPSVAGASELPTRKPGMWVIASEDNAFANWVTCIESGNDDFVNSDIWTGYRKECKGISITRTAVGQRLTADCDDGMGGNVKLGLDFAGDFQTAYVLQSKTEFAGLNGQLKQQIFTIEARYAGECPADLAPGKKKMGRP